MSTPDDFRAILAGCTGREHLAPLVRALGFDPVLESVPREAHAAWGLAGADDVHRLAVVGRAGSLDALLIEAGSRLRPERVSQLVRGVQRRNPARLHLLVLAGPGYRWLSLATAGMEEEIRQLALDPAGPRQADLETLVDMAPRDAETGLQLALRHGRALDRSRITRRFFRDFRARRTAVAAAWSGLPATADADRAQLALLFLSRLTFLYFLQRRGALAGDDRYLPTLFGRWSDTGARSIATPGLDRETFYRARLTPLFFGALNRRPEDRSAAARELGDLPYLNGGLFERHALERRHPDLDLADEEVASCFDDLLERYRFTVREAGGFGEQGVDPEILGRVFEGLMAPEQRSDTGSFYTPAPVVERVVREAVATYVASACTAGEAREVVSGRGVALPEETRHRVRARLERVRVLDPACGSGAFLLGALHRLTASLAPLTPDEPGAVRRRLVGRALHGVDLLDDAALLCSLRLWLALTVDDDRIRPLPNLDRRVRQGDALIDPLDLEALEVDGSGAPAWRPAADPELRAALRAVRPAAQQYLESAPEERDALRDALQRAEVRLARRWLRGSRRAHRDRLRGLQARAADRDLFGGIPESARSAGVAAARVQSRIAELDELAAAVEDAGALPFFSFGVHFADAADGFDLILSNPPWVRAHRWPERVRQLSDRYEVCRTPAWSGAARLTGAPAGAGAQVDLSLLFIERAIRLLAPGGVLAVLLPAKALRALYGGAGRRMLLRDLELALIEDHALDQRSIFRADAFAAVLVARKRPAPAPAAGTGALRIRLVRRGVEPLECRVEERQLPLFPDDPSSPWLLAPAEVVAAFRTMQAAGWLLGTHSGLRVRRGVMTGANDVLLFRSMEPKLGGLCAVEAEGYRRARQTRQAAPADTGAEGGVASSESYRAVVEMEGLRPLVRGADVDAFRYDISTHTTWCHDTAGAPVPPPTRLGRYLERHRERLAGRSGWREPLPLGVIFRLSADTIGPKVAWHDLSDTLRAVALPATISVAGVQRELIPLNTVYFLPVKDQEHALLLAGLFNSLPVRVMARAVAERAKDARFRFFAWVVSSLPLPPGWAERPQSARIARISRRAHDDGGISPRAARELDRLAAALYGLDDRDLTHLRGFDAWLRGEGPWRAT